MQYDVIQNKMEINVFLQICIHIPYAQLSTVSLKNLFVSIQI